MRGRMSGSIGSSNLLTGTLIAYLAISVSAYGQDALKGTEAEAFAAAAHALSNSAADLVENGKANARLNAVRTVLTTTLFAVTKVLEAKKEGDEHTEITLSTLNEVNFLCQTRVDHIQNITRRNYIEAVAAQIDAIGKSADIKDLSSAIAVFFANYSMNVPALPNKTEFEKIASRIYQSCKDDLKDFEKDYYGVALPAGPLPVVGAGEISLSWLGPIGALIDTVIAVITPVLESAAKIADAEKRREAVRQYLIAHQSELVVVGNILSSQIAVAIKSKRLSLVGAFESSLVALRNKKIDLSKHEECKDLPTSKTVRNPTTGGPSDQFMLCWQAAWDDIKSLAADSSTAAATYDQIADVGSEENIKRAFQEFTKHLNRIKDGTEDNFANLWQIVSQMVALSQKIKEAASQENRDKIEKAIKALTK